MHVVKVNRDVVIVKELQKLFRDPGLDDLCAH